MARICQQFCISLVNVNDPVSYFRSQHKKLSEQRKFLGVSPLSAAFVVNTEGIQITSMDYKLENRNKKQIRKIQNSLKTRKKREVYKRKEN